MWGSPDCCPWPAIRSLLPTEEPGAGCTALGMGCGLLEAGGRLLLLSVAQGRAGSCCGDLGGGGGELQVGPGLEGLSTSRP